jgi:hypothetical protein
MPSRVAVAERSASPAVPWPGTSIRVGNGVLDAAPLLKALPPDATQDNDELELEGGRVYPHLGVRRDEPPRR